MVDNKGITPVNGYFRAGDSNSMTNKMSDEKQGQGGEYFAQEMQDDDSNKFQENQYQDRSAQLRASLDSLAMVNVGSMNFMARKNQNKLKDKKEKLKQAENINDNIDTEEEVYNE